MHGKMYHLKPFLQNLWPSHPLSCGNSELTGPQESENNGTVLTSDLQEARVELYEKCSSGPTIADISNWLTGGEEENLQIMTDDKIINNVLAARMSKSQVLQRLSAQYDTKTP
jgi:hypothetical protein